MRCAWTASSRCRREGPLRCADGYLCTDARGYPYPVAADEFALIYKEA